MSYDADQIVRRLEDMQKRLELLEGNSHIISEERTEVAAEGELENEITETRNNTAIMRHRIPICDYCGRQIDSFSKCQRCGKKLCVKCSLDFRNQVICKQDLQKIFPLSRDAFKVLLVIGNGITNDGHIHKLTGIPKKNLHDMLQYLKGAGYADSSIFGGKMLTEMGREALGCYCQILGDSVDMKSLDEAIMRHVLAK